MRPGVELFPVSLALISVVYHFRLIPLHAWIPALGAALIFLSLSARQYDHPALRMLVTLAVSAALAGAFAAEASGYRKTTRLDLPRGEYLSMRGRLAGFPRLEPKASRLMLEIHSVYYRRRLRRVCFRLDLKVPGDLRHLFTGDRLEVDASVYPAQISGGRGSYFMARKIHFSGRCKSGAQVRRLDSGPWIWSWLGGRRNGFRQLLEQCFATSRGEISEKGALLEAMLLGDRGHLPDSFRRGMMEAGVFHLVAISGTHVAILALMMLMGMRWAKVRGWWRWGFTSGLLLGYLSVAGFPVSAVRAVIMVVVLLLGRELGYQSNPLRILSLTGLAMLSINPLASLDVGFLLTFSLAGVIVLGRGLAEYFPKWVPRSLSALICATMNVATAALPLSLYFFHRYALVAPLSGIFLIPLCGPLLVLGIGALLVSFCSAALAIPILSLTRIVVNFLSGGISLAASTGSTIHRLGPPASALILIGFLLLLIHRGKKARIRGSAAILLFVVLLASAWRHPPRRPEEMEVHFLDVGQGDCSCIVFPGGDALLIDGGGDRRGRFSVGRMRVFPYLLAQRIRVRWMAVSHFHPDHAAGILDLIPLVRPHEVWISSAPRDDPLFRRLMGPEGPRVRVRRVVRGVVMLRGKHRVTCCHPRRFRFSRLAGNENSQVLRVEDGRHGFLFTGDAGFSTEKELIGSGEKLKEIQVLKLGHHGSRLSSGPEFLKAVSPGIAVISRAASNPFGFPHPQVLERLEGCGISWLDTAWCGTILIECREKGIWVRSALEGAKKVDFSPDIE